MIGTDFDALTIPQLQEGGAVKWSMFPDAIGAFVAEMDFGLAPSVRSALQSALDRAMTGYLSPELSGQLATATASWYAQSYGWQIDPGQVHHVSDVIAALELTIDHYTRPGSAVIVPTPAYMPFLTIPPMHGREVIEVPCLDGESGMALDLEAIARAFDAGAQLLVLCNPHNPLGAVATREELIRIATLVDAKGGRVFSDEIHAPLIYDGRRHVPYASVSPEAASHTITAASASKAWNLAGLKCAQVILSNDADAEHWKSFGPMAEHATATLGVIAGTAAYTAGRQWLESVIEYLDGNRRLLAELVEQHLPGVRMRMPEATYIALLDFRETGLTGDLGAWFREHAGVAMTDGAACGTAGIGYARFIFAMPRPVLRTAIERMGAALAAR